MTTLRTNGQIDSNGRLHLNLQTPLSQGEVQITVVIDDSPNGHKYDFSDLAGKLYWQGDALAEQRRMRDEW